LRWQIKHQHGQAGDKETGDDEVDGVEQRKPPDNEVVGDVRVDLCAALVLFGVVLAHCIDDDPLAALPVVYLVHVAGHADEVNLGAVVGPRAKLHLAALLVKREEGDVYAAGRLVDGRWNPLYPTIMEQMRLRELGHRKVAISAAHTRTGRERGEKWDRKCT